MRVIAGAQKGRRLAGPKGHDLRPTADRVKEALFSIIGARLVDARFLDLYAGTGSVGIEALSRGAGHVAFVESNPTTLQLLRMNLDRCGLAGRGEVHACPAATFLEEADPDTFDIIFADPPYSTDGGTQVLQLLDHTQRVAQDSMVILEHSTKLTPPSVSGRLSRRRQYRYGDTSLSIYALTVVGDRAP